MKNEIILLFVTFLILCEICLYVNGKKLKNKVLKQQVILKDITTSIDKCVKNDKNIDKNEKAKFNKCLTGLKKQKNTLAAKDKSTKIIFKKVIKDIIKCLKPKKSKTSKENKNKTSNKKRQKRAPPPKRKGDKEPEGVIAKLEKIETNPECSNELSSSSDGEEDILDSNLLAQDTQDGFLALTDAQIEILEGAYENDETVGPIDIERVNQLIDLMEMEKGEASVIAVENWWTSKYLLEEIRNSETNQATVTFTDKMKDYLQLQYDRNPDLGQRAQIIADQLKLTKGTLKTYWSKMRKEQNNPGVKRFTPDQLEILTTSYNNDKNFSPSQMALELGLDPKNQKEVRRIENWKQRQARKLAKEKDPSKASSSKN